MGQSEFNDDIKNKLEQRSLSPSDGAWDKLEVMLDNKDRSVMRRQYRRYFIAASMLLLIGLSYLYLSQENSVIEERSLVNDETVIEVTPNKNEVNTQVAIVKNNTNSLVSEDDGNKEFKRQIPSKRSIKIAHDARNQVVLALVDNKNVKESSLEEELVLENVVSTKTVRDVDAEVEALLADAMRKLPVKEKVDDRAKEQSTYVVDEKALLASVEQEMDISFKEKIFKKIKEGFQKTKTVVVKRNQDDFQNH